MKKFTPILALLILLLVHTPVSAQEEGASSSNTPVVTIDEYSKYVSLFTDEFKWELLKGEFARIDQKIKGYEGDIEYISSEKGSQYAGNLDIYKTKLKALRQVRQEYISYYKEETKTSDTTKEEISQKEKILKAAQEKKEKELREAKQKIEEKKKVTEEVKEKVEVKKTEVTQNLEKKKSEIIAQHKEKFAKKLAKTLENLSVPQLEKVLARVNALIEKNANKENLLAQLMALKELIQEKIDGSEELDVESLFEGL